MITKRKEIVTKIVGDLDIEEATLGDLREWVNLLIESGFTTRDSFTRSGYYLLAEKTITEEVE